MAILDDLIAVEKSLLGVVEDAAGAAGGVVVSTVKGAAEAVHNVIETLGGAVAGSDE